MIPSGRRRYGLAASRAIGRRTALWQHASMISGLRSFALNVSATLWVDYTVAGDDRIGDYLLHLTQIYLLS
jgi:hypothetical protein